MTGGTKPARKADVTGGARRPSPRASPDPCDLVARLCRAYGLTRAEGEVALGFARADARGDRVGAIAGTRRTTRQTVDNQIKAVMAKADVHDRAGLMHALLSVVPELLGGDAADAVDAALAGATGEGAVRREARGSGGPSVAPGGASLSAGR